MIKGIQDYLTANKEELLTSPLQLKLPGEKYSFSQDMLNCCKGTIPLLMELAAGICITALYIQDYNLRVILSDVFIVADLVSREQGVEETNTFGYGLVGRIRDAYKTLSKNYSKKP